MSMNHGNLVGFLEEDGRIGCPVLRIAEVTAEGFTLSWPSIGITRVYEDDGLWARLEGKELSEATGCGCYRCSSPLLGLALEAD